AHAAGVLTPPPSATAVGPAGRPRRAPPPGRRPGLGPAQVTEAATAAAASGQRRYFFSSAPHRALIRASLPSPWPPRPPPPARPAPPARGAGRPRGRPPRRRGRGNPPTRPARTRLLLLLLACDWAAAPCAQPACPSPALASTEAFCHSLPLRAHRARACAPDL